MSSLDIAQLHAKVKGMKNTHQPSSRVESYEKIRLYNFRIPNRFTKDQIRVLRGIFENFSTSLSSHLSGLLRKFCQVELMSVEEHTFSEFTNALIDPVMLAIIDLASTKGLTLMEMSASLTCGIIDRLMGGTGRYTNQERNYTEIEIALMERLTSQFLEIMHESWSIFVEIDPRLERIETRTQFAQIVPANEIIAIITFSVKMGEVDGTINYCIPHIVVETLLRDAKTKTDYYKATIPDLESREDEILNKIEKTSLQLVSTFADTAITPKEVMMLQVGDVLMLDHKANEPVNIKINNVIKFKGYLGAKNNRKSVKLSYKMNLDDL